MRQSLFLCLTVLMLMPTLALAASQCIVCHNTSTGMITSARGEIDISLDVRRFEASVHGGLPCESCHETYGDNPHMPAGSGAGPDVAALADKIKVKAKHDPIAMAACSGCHPDIYERVLQSAHGRSIQNGNPDGALCLDCHGAAHYITSVTNASSPLNRANVTSTCAKCHENDTIAAKYGLNPDVVETFRESFHGKKLAFGHTKVPTCVGCHASHEIAKTDAPESPVLGHNKVHTCDKCHVGANERFVPSITHKEAGMIPHFAEKGLIMLLMGTIAFVVLHFILEAYSDIRDTFFRAAKEDDDENQ